MSMKASDLYEFGPYRLDLAKRLLTCYGERVTLAPKAYELLLVLVQGEGRALSKQELMGALWPDTIVEEANLAFQINALRKALGEEGNDWVETVPRHGYRFTAPVRMVSNDGGRSDGSERPSPHPPAGPTRPFVPWVVATLTTLAFLILAAAHFREEPPVLQPFRFSIPLPEGATVNDLSLSPDGHYLAISAVVAGKGSLWIRPLDGAEARSLAGTEDSRFPFWSPDSRFIGFFA